VPFCNSCGVRVPDGARFCQACGAPLAGAPTPVPRPGAALPTAPELRLQPLPPPPDLPFHPQSDEVIYRQIVPHPRLRWRLMLGGILSSIVVLLFIVPVGFSLLVSPSAASGSLTVLAALLVGVFLLIVVVSVVYALIAYSKFRYWITNHRTVGRRGVIGYSIDSIPLETISDVVVQRSVADRLLGLSSIWIQPFGGASSGGYGAAQYRFGAISGSNSFLGLEPADATNVQQLIFHLRDVRRRETGRII
jgi:membrane protein YdbS with pleckstrin-like domain